MRKGFTLIELLIVVAILVVISVAGFINATNYRNKQTLVDSTNQILAVLHDAQNRSITQQNGQQWGIRFTNATSGTDFYQIFNGASYSTSSVNQTFYLSNNTQFGEPGSGLSVDEIFNPITGQLAADKIISIITGKQDGLVGDIILHSQGTVTTRQDYGLVGYWHFDENTSTTAYDASGYGNNGFLISSPTWQSASNCKAGSCLSFNGGNYVKATSSTSLNIGGNAITVTAWFNRTAVVDYQRIIGKYYYSAGDSGSWLMFFTASSTNQVQCRFNAGGSWVTATGPASVNLNQWNFAACVYNGSTFTAYLNNTSSTVSKTGNLATSNYPVTIAATSDGTNVQNYFSGRIDEVRMYNRGLSPTEISNIYNDIQ